MTAAIRHLPNLADACARITARARDENIAEERAIAIREAKRIINDPRGKTDAQLREVCAAFMAMHPTPDELADDWNVYYLRADQHIFAINRREQVARNKARAQALQDALRQDETPLRVAMRHAHLWPQIVAGGIVGALVLLAVTGWL